MIELTFARLLSLARIARMYHTKQERRAMLEWIIQKYKVNK